MPSWWECFWSGNYDWRWSSPHLCSRSKLEYVPITKTPFSVVDGLGRKKVFRKPFECYIDPFSGKIKKLYVQAPGSICHLSGDKANATWGRTPIRNATPIWLRVADLPYRGIPIGRRGDSSKFTAEDYLVIAATWLFAVVVFCFCVR